MNIYSMLIDINTLRGNALGTESSVAARRSVGSGVETHVRGLRVPAGGCPRSAPAENCAAFRGAELPRGAAMARVGPPQTPSKATLGNPKKLCPRCGAHRTPRR